MKAGDIVVNVDGWIGMAIEVTDTHVKMRYNKCDKYRIENWDIESVRPADESEHNDFRRLKEGCSVDPSTKGKAEADIRHSFRPLFPTKNSTKEEKDG